ncbi:uncharacterized protein LAJ45_01002 [Morchella importuna]|uniref:uncharacterized protein n=1 Tax=Morchella importuna TaxID=1174673 RepID=UPI001E8EF022|nr:uncharacterized protein LAJ45_01002 [Morchella importuna]KAH8154475.1 hypothetical protein LAJ45_01002 [Morchella importuna]
MGPLGTAVTRMEIPVNPQREQPLFFPTTFIDRLVEFSNNRARELRFGFGMLSRQDSGNRPLSEQSARGS